MDKFEIAIRKEFGEIILPNDNSNKQKWEIAKLEKPEEDSNAEMIDDTKILEEIEDFDSEYEESSFFLLDIFSGSLKCVSIMFSCIFTGIKQGIHIAKVRIAPIEQNNEGDLPTGIMVIIMLILGGISVIASIIRFIISLL